MRSVHPTYAHTHTRRVFVNVCVFVCLLWKLCVFVYVHVCRGNVCVYVCVCVCLFMCMFVVEMCVCMCVCVSLCMGVHAPVHVCISNVLIQHALV